MSPWWYIADAAGAVVLTVPWIFLHLADRKYRQAVRDYYQGSQR